MLGRAGEVEKADDDADETLEAQQDQPQWPPRQQGSVDAAADVGEQSLPEARAGLQEPLPEGSASVGTAGQTHVPDSLAELNAKQQAQAWKWLRKQPLGMIMSLRLCLRPLVSLLGSYLERSGNWWEQTQRAHEARCLAGLVDADTRKTALVSTWP